MLISHYHPSYSLDLASSLSSGVGYLFESFQSIWLKIAQHLVVNFVVSRRAVELQSFYSAILMPSPLLCVLFKSGVSVSTSPLELLHTTPLAFNARSSGGSFSQCQISRSQDLTWGSELSLLQLSHCDTVTF